MDRRQERWFSVGGALVVGVGFTLLYTWRERRFRWAGVLAALAWWGVSTAVRRLLLFPPRE